MTVLKGPVARPIVIIGAGGFGRETLDVVEDVSAHGLERYQVRGVIDPNPGDANLRRLAQRQVEYLGADEDWLPGADVEFFAVGIGDPFRREMVASRYLDAGMTPVTLVHPTAVVGRRTHLSPGVTVCAGAVVSTNVNLGSFATLNPSVTIGHDSQIGRFVSVNPGAVVSGEVLIGDRSLVGAGAVILQNLIIGSGCVIGASACVTRDVSDGGIVKGVPAR